MGVPVIFRGKFSSLEGLLIPNPRLGMFVLQNYMQRIDAIAENPMSSLEEVNGLLSEVKLAHQPCDNEPERPHKYCSSELHPYKRLWVFLE